MEKHPKHGGLEQRAQAAQKAKERRPVPITMPAPPKPTQEELIRVTKITDSDAMGVLLGQDI